MSRSDGTPDAPDPGIEGGDPELLARLEHLRALNSAWAALAPFGFSDAGRHIVETGRAVGAELTELASQPSGSREPGALTKLDGLLDAIESDMRSLAFEVPVAELRSTLPARLEDERRGILDLLDLMLAPGLEEPDGLAGRISSIDYLITLLSMDESGGVAQDPVSLTPRLAALCARADESADSRMAQIGAEFYAAAEVGERQARNEIQLRALRTRKRELGASFFAPRVLRAIVSYNAALSRRIERGVWDSRDWGSLPGGAEPSTATESVFGTEALPRLADALRQRAAGHAPTTSAIDRVAWCLDLASLDEAERAALHAPDTGRPGQLAGTAALVGLLCRSAAVLEGEFPAIGISPERLATEWVKELDDALRRGVQERITGNAYEEACLLSELRTALGHAVAGVEHERIRRRPGTPRPQPPRPEPAAREAREGAGRALRREAREGAGRALRREPPRPSPAAPREQREPRRPWPWERLEGPARLGGAVALLSLLLLGLGRLLGGDGNLDALDGAALERVSPYLERGARSEEGRGSAFVGTLDDAWSRLVAEEQQEAAQALVEALRAQGVREIMVYDDERRLRIQALGRQPARVLPAPGP